MEKGHQRRSHCSKGSTGPSVYASPSWRLAAFPSRDSGQDCTAPSVRLRACFLSSLYSYKYFRPGIRAVRNSEKLIYFTILNCWGKSGVR